MRPLYPDFAELVVIVNAVCRRLGAALSHSHNIIEYLHDLGLTALRGYGRIRDVIDV